MATLAIAVFTVAPPSSAHERDTFKIGGKYYVLTVGSLNEPFVVDNISGVDLRVSQVTGPAGNGSSKEASKGVPVTGLEQSLKVELAAGDKRKRSPSILPTKLREPTPRISFPRCKLRTAIASSAQSTTAPWTSHLLASTVRFQRPPKIILR